MEGLKIRTVSGRELDVFGPVDRKEFPEDGVVYYCGGESWPGEIVVEVLSDGR